MTSSILFLKFQLRASSQSEVALCVKVEANLTSVNVECANICLIFKFSPAAFCKLGSVYTILEFIFFERLQENLFTLILKLFVDLRNFSFSY